MTAPSELAALLPCPFCGGDTERICNGLGWPVVECNQCGARGPCIHRNAESGEYVKDWNTRLAASPSAMKEALEEIWCLREVVRGVRMMSRIGAFKEYEGEPWLMRVRNIDLDSTLASLDAPAKEAAAPAAGDLPPDEFTRENIKTRAAKLIMSRGWKPGSNISLHSAIELLTAFGMDLVRKPETDRCNYPECGCDFDAVCNEGLKKLSAPPLQAPADSDAVREALLSNPKIARLRAASFVSSAAFDRLIGSALSAALTAPAAKALAVSEADVGRKRCERREVKLTEIELSQLQQAERGVDIRSSDRPTDRARTKLKRLGFLVYERSCARWQITDAGSTALEQSKEK